MYIKDAAIHGSASILILFSSEENVFALITNGLFEVKKRSENILISYIFSFCFNLFLFLTTPFEKQYKISLKNNKW